MVQTLTADDFSRVYSPSVVETLAQRIPGVVTSDIQGNSFVQDLRYRGFAASPLQGTPQGLAVYMQGIRVNEAFGDTVNWDLIPTVAIGRADIWTNNPAFGLNALGGAVNLQMKDGFTYNGFEVDTSGGSYGRVGGSLQYGVRKGEWGLYLAAEGFKDDGWRYQSPSRLARFYGDLGWRGTDAEVHFITSVADNYFGVVGPTPIELLNNDYRAIYTWPQTTKNQAQLIAMNGRYSVTDHWTVQSNLYHRKFQQAHVDGNTAEVERCSGQAGNPLLNTLCLENDGFPTPAAGELPASQPEQSAHQLPARIGQHLRHRAMGHGRSHLDQCDDDGRLAAGPSTTTRYSATTTTSSSAAASTAARSASRPTASSATSIPISSLVRTRRCPGRDRSSTPPAISASARSASAPGIPTMASTSTTPSISPIGCRSRQADATTSRRSAMSDLFGTSPDLNAQYTFERFNPVVGFTYKILPELMTFYAGYSEANRAPTPLELGCSNPLRPCLLEGFLVSDPPLNQVVARTKEVGLRGNINGAGGRGDWKLGLFRTDSESDIIQVASVLQGRGVFQNVPGTRRQGLEAGVNYQTAQYLVYANYALVDATYQFTGLLASPNNPSADANGDILVTPGKQIPGIPRHQIKGGVDYFVTPLLKLGTDVIWVSSQWYVGDDANQNVKLADYWVANLHGSYQLTKELQVYGLINNLFNRKFATYGTYFDPQSVVNAVANPPTDHRTITPAQPLSIYVGLRAKL